MRPVQTFVEAPGPQGPLKGTMLGPASGPVGLIIPGSGPTDRDGNGGVGLRAQTLRFLAEGLADAGVTTVRIDKRGMYGSQAAVADANAVMIADYVADIEAWITVIRSLTGVSDVWLLGHSEGAFLSLVAARSVPHIAGLVLMASPGRPLAEILREQLAPHPQLLDEATPIIAALAAGEHVDGAGMSAGMLGLFRPQVQAYMIEMMALDPASLVSVLAMPILILQGNHDLQVGVRDAQRLADAAPAAKLVVLPTANHVLKSVETDERGANLATYADPSLPLADGIVASISTFIKAVALV